MSAPPLSDFQTSNVTDVVDADEITASLTWPAGAFIVLLGLTADNDGLTLNLPTVLSGLTFTLITSTATPLNGKVYLWTATAAGSGSGVITSHESDGVAGMRALIAFAFTGSDGLGATALMASTSTTNATQALTRSGNNSAVIAAMVDWNAINDVGVATNPAGGTVRVIGRDAVGAQSTMYVGSWPDEGAAGTTSYGIGSYTATPKWIGLVVEVLGSGGGGADTLWAASLM